MSSKSRDAVVHHVRDSHPNKNIMIVRRPSAKLQPQKAHGLNAAAKPGTSLLQQTLLNASPLRPKTDESPSPTKTPSSQDSTESGTGADSETKDKTSREWLVCCYDPMFGDCIFCDL